jgi:hypothetical protein
MNDTVEINIGGKKLYCKKSSVKSVGGNAEKYLKGYPPMMKGGVIINEIKNKLGDETNKVYLQSEFIELINEKLSEMDTGKTLAATSFCCDEVNRPFEKAIQGLYGESFNLGGLSGFPFAGKTGIGAMKSHIPDDGNLIVVYGPHVGFLGENFGNVKRVGREVPNGCCGSAIGALREIKNYGQRETVDPQQSQVVDPVDPQQSQVVMNLRKKIEGRQEVDNFMLAEKTYEAINENIDLLLQKKVIKNIGCTILIGGILINTGHDEEDCFLIKRFDKFKNGNQQQISI